MSFRTRLLIFFVIIVVVPMFAAGVVLLDLASRSQVERLDARVGQALTSAAAAYREDVDRAGNSLERLTGDEDLRIALTRGRPREVQRALEVLERKTPSLRAMSVADRDGEIVASVGPSDPVAAISTDLRDQRDRRLGAISVSNTSARGFAGEARRLTGLEAQVVDDGELAATTFDEGAAAPGATGPVLVANRDYRAGEVELDPSESLDLSLYLDATALDASIADQRRLVIGLLVGFLVLALLSSIFVVRALQSQIAGFLAAARALGRGQFDQRVPTVGNDEFAQLGAEFNSMSGRLEGQIEEIERQRTELEESIRRVGEAFAAGLDAEEIVAVAVRTAVEACGAEVGRALPVGRSSRPMTVLGAPEGDLLAALERAEALAVDARGMIATDRSAAPVPAETATAVAGGAHALAASLTATPDAGPDVRAAAVVAIARQGAPFTEAERDLFGYLAERAAVSFENAGLHRTIKEQAITDGLTGLFNRRRFEELLANETARAKRLGHPLGLIMMDVDGFKAVNDRFGHAAGDQALVGVAGLLQSQAREIDLAGRYGGDEFVVLLPETDLDGAAVLADRMRRATEGVVVTAPDGSRVPVTASLGVASLPESAVDGEGLMAAADLALYDAKRGGKNRVSRSEAAPYH